MRPIIFWVCITAATVLSGLVVLKILRTRNLSISDAIAMVAILISIAVAINTSPTTAPRIDPTAAIASATKELSAMQNGEFDLQTRLAGINTLRSLATQNPPDDYYQQSIDILTIYIKNNVGDRKRSGPGITMDRGTYIAQDIIVALNALQQIRKASNDKAQVKLVGINFDKINFEDTDLSYFDLSFSTFNHAILPRTCRYTNFSFSKFDDAAIWNADLTGAKFHKANLHGAKFASVDFTGSNIEEASDFSVQLLADSKGLTQQQRSLFPIIP